MGRCHESEGGDLLLRLSCRSFYVPEHGLLPQFLVMAGTFVGVEAVIEILLATFVGNVVAHVTSGTAMRMFNRATGSVFVLAGSYLLTLESPR